MKYIIQLTSEKDSHQFTIEPEGKPDQAMCGAARSLSDITMLLHDIIREYELDGLEQCPLCKCGCHPSARVTVNSHCPTPCAFLEKSSSPVNHSHGTNVLWI